MRALRFIAGDRRYLLVEGVYLHEVSADYEEVPTVSLPTVISSLRRNPAVRGQLRRFVFSSIDSRKTARHHQPDATVWRSLEVALGAGGRLRLFRRLVSAAGYAPPVAPPAAVAPAQPATPTNDKPTENKPELTSELSVFGLAPDAKVFLNGADTGKSNVHQEFARDSEVEIRVEAPGHQTETKKVKLSRPKHQEIVRLKKETSIPDWQEDGNLPPGVHVATWDEVEERFGNTYERNQLLKGLRRAMDDLKRAGCKRVFIDGSFVTTKGTGLPGAEQRAPGDFDGAWDTAGVDQGRLRDTTPFLDEEDLTTGRMKQKYKYGGEMFPADAVEGGSGGTFVQFFQRDKRSGAPKGIIAVDL